MGHHHEHHYLEKEIQEGKFFAVISYISFLCVIALILKKHNRFALYHAKQGLVIFVFEVVAFILSIIPLLGWLIRIAGFLIFSIASLWGILRAFSGNDARIPVVTNIAHKISL